MEEVRSLQSRMDKSKPDANTLFSTIQSGASLSLHAVQANVGRWAACSKTDSPGLWIEWALEGERLYRGDRILEINGQILTCKTREELQKIIGITGKCLIVVVRKRSAPIQQQQLLQSQEDNQRLQHRISYLEDQVKDLLQSKEGSPIINGKGGTHVTSISISSPATTPTSTEKPQIFQRGNYVTTIIGGKPVDSPPPSHKSHITKTIIKEPHQNGRINGNLSVSTENHIGQNNKALSASKISINSDISHLKRERHREKEQRREEIRREELRRDEQRRDEQRRKEEELQRREDHRREDQRREDQRREDKRREDYEEQLRERHYNGLLNGNQINGYRLSSNHGTSNGNLINGNYTNGSNHSNGKSINGNQINGNYINGNHINGNGNHVNGHQSNGVSSRNSSRYSDSEGSNHFHGYNSYARSVEHLNYSNGYVI